MRTKYRKFQQPGKAVGRGFLRLKFRLPGIRTTFLATGFPVLDEMISGQPKSSLIVLAGDRIAHRTGLAANIARHIAVNGNRPVLYCPLDGRAGIFAMQLIGNVADMRLFFGPPGETTIEPFTVFAKQIRRQEKIGLVIIDHLGRLNADGDFDSREDEIAQLSIGLKRLARNLAIPIMALVNLEDEPPPTRSPFVSDLGIYDVLGQDADLVLFATATKLFITKNRYGPEGDICLNTVLAAGQGRAS